METHDNNRISKLMGPLASFARRCIFNILSIGPIPTHVSFIMDGNRRFAKKKNLEIGGGHKAGFTALMSMLKYCYELGIKFVSIYAFSIDNFKRRPDEVQILMDLMLQRIEGLLKEESIVNQYGIRVYFIGNLKLLTEPIRVAAEKVMKTTAINTKFVLLICVAYTSTDEIAYAVEETCREKWNRIELGNSAQLSEFLDDMDEAKTCNRILPGEESEKIEPNFVAKLIDIENPMYLAGFPDPDILIRTSGETRLSNFHLWKATYCLLYSPPALWPEIGMQHLVWAVLNFQRNHSYLEKRKKQM